MAGSSPTPQGRRGIEYVELDGRRLPGVPAPGVPRRRPVRDRWRALPAGGRRLVAALVAAVLVAGVAAAALSARRAADAERAAAEAVALDVEVRVTTSALPSPGGSVIFYLVARNEGPRDVELLGLRSVRQGLAVEGRLDRPRSVGAGDFTLVRLSVRLSCSAGVPPAGPLPADVEVRRADGEVVVRTVVLREGEMLRRRAEVVCQLRPRDGEQQLSGPVIVSG